MDIRIFILVLIFACGQFACSSSVDRQTNDVSSDTTTVTDKSNILADTIEIWDSFASEPFLFHDWQVSLDSVLLFLPSSVILESEVRPSQYHENANDSITRIKFGQSIIEYIKAPTVGYIEIAIITESEIQFQKNIRIGDSYSDICKKFPDADKGDKPFRKIYINSGEATSTLIIEFKNDKLFKVTYWPYTG